MDQERENKLIEIASRWEWMCDLLDMKEVPVVKMGENLDK